MTRFNFQKSEKCAFLTFCKGYIYIVRSKIVKTAVFVDEVEIDKIRNTAESLSFMDSRNRFGFIVWKKQLNKPFCSRKMTRLAIF